MLETRHMLDIRYLRILQESARSPAIAASCAACLPHGRAVATCCDTVDRGEKPDASTLCKVGVKDFYDAAHGR